MDPNLREGVAHLGDVPLLLEAVVPCIELTVAELLALDEGSLVQTSRAAGESVDVSVGGRLVAQAELIVIEDSLAARLSDFGEKI